MSLYSNSLEIELIQLTKSGNKDAYAEIYNRYKRLLFMHAFKRLNDGELCKDVVQDVFVVFWQKRDILKINNSLRAYLFTSVRNRIFDILSHERVTTEYISQFLKFSDSPTGITADYKIRYNQLLEIIEKEIEALPSKMREVFRLSRDEQLTYGQISKKLNISEDTVKEHMKKALRILKGKLGALFIFLFI